MTDWLRVLGLSLLSLLIALGLVATGWIVWSKRKLSQFRFSPKQQADITASRVGWWPEQQKKNPRIENDDEIYARWRRHHGADP